MYKKEREGNDTEERNTGEGDSLPPGFSFQNKTIHNTYIISFLNRIHITIQVN